MIVRDPSPSPSVSPAQPASPPSPAQPASPPSPVSEPPTGDTVAAFYKELASAAVDLNAASDELGKCVTALDATLKPFNLGISTWVRVAGEEDQYLNFWVHKLGYAKVAGRWGIALLTMKGNETDPERIEAEEWLFNDAPRALRIEAVDKIPELLQELIKEARRTSQQIKEKTAQARQLATAISEAAAELAAKRK